MHRPRPKNLNLFTIHFPLPAIVSILHRITGVCLLLLVPFVLWLLDYSLTNEGFESIQQRLDSNVIKFILWLVLVPFCFHLVAGVRHLLADIHIGDTLKLGRFTSLLTFVLTILLVILAGIWIW